MSSQGGGRRRASTSAGAMPAYRLVRATPRPVAVPVLDAAQHAVVSHPGGPLLVLAGPGTGKTTTIVEAVVARIEAGADPEQVLVLTFGRRAAAELRSRITARLGRATREPLARTFHSYAFGLIRREAAARGEASPRLLAGPEQDLVVRDLLAGDLAGGARDWPARLHQALATRGFAQELRDLLMRASERGLAPEDLARLGRAQGRDDWGAAASFMRQYAGVTALQDAAGYDNAELMRAVIGLWEADPDLLAAERSARRYVFVDELQDTDPAQMALLHLLAGQGRDLVAVGDPDQSVYGFRGADVAGIRSFRDRFPTAEGESAPVVSLTTSRRSGSVLLSASRRVAASLGGPRRHRDLVAAAGMPAGEVAVAVLRSESQEAASVAAHLRQAHLVHGVPWSRMAVVVRSTVHSMPVLRRAMLAVGVPVAVSGDEIPLVAEPAVRPLLLLLECAARPGTLDEELAAELVTSAVGGADVMGLRRLRQALRRVELDSGGVRASGPLLVEALEDPTVLATLDRAAVRPAAVVASLLATAREGAAAPGASAEEVLWKVWQQTGLAGRWERASREGGAAGEAADRDLDAVVALFETAARFCDRLPMAGPEVFLDHLLGQEIPGGETAVRIAGDDAVQVLTAHACKGLEWDVVCVAAVQEGSWPDLRMRGSFLGSERLVDLLRSGAQPTADQVATTATLARLLEEERRLFYVAVTRARRSLLVTAVTSEREGLNPSRFLDELDPVAGEEGRPLTVVTRPMSLTGLVADLRRVLGDPAATEPLRAAAAARLATLAAVGARGAHPDAWWGLLDLSDDRPVRAADEVVSVSPSKVEAFRRCELRWFLEHVGGGTAPGPAQVVGTLVHAVAEKAVTPETSTVEVLQKRLTELLPRTDLGSGWVARKERVKAEQMVTRLAAWLAGNSREVIATELDFAAELGRARVVGRVDRVERDDDGRIVVVDLKTGTTKVDPVELARHGQLATYQVAVEHGGFAVEHGGVAVEPDGVAVEPDGVAGKPGGTAAVDQRGVDPTSRAGLSASGGAELVQVGKAGGATYAVQSQPPLADGDNPAWARELVLEVAEGMAGSAFQAVENKHCTRCPVRTSCPVQDDGRVVTT